MEKQSGRIDIPKGYGRFWFEREADYKDGKRHLVRIRFVIAKSDQERTPGDDDTDPEAKTIDEICSIEIANPLVALKLAEQFEKLAKWMMEEMENAKQEGIRAGTHMAEKQDG